MDLMEDDDTREELARGELWKQQNLPTPPSIPPLLKQLFEKELAKFQDKENVPPLPTSPIF